MDVISGAVQRAAGQRLGVDGVERTGQEGASAGARHRRRDAGSAQRHNTTARLAQGPQTNSGNGRQGQEEGLRQSDAGDAGVHRRHGGGAHDARRQPSAQG